MLTDVTFNRSSHPLALIFETPQRLQQGVYQSRHWNFQLMFRDRQNFDLDYPFLAPDLDCIGVCDSPQQLLEKLPRAVTEGPVKYVISLVQIRKADQSPQGGWRWHKWGPYIGAQEPTTEYLYDEPAIQEVWTYHVYQVEPAAGEEPPCLPALASATP